MAECPVTMEDCERVECEIHCVRMESHFDDMHFDRTPSSIRHLTGHIVKMAKYENQDRWTHDEV